MKLFTKVKTITSKAGKVHFERWAIFETKWLSLYLHRIHEPDQDHLHSHPWKFVSLILKGSYEETLSDSEGNVVESIKSPGKVTWFPLHLFHKIAKVTKAPCWTLVLVRGGSFEGDKWHYLVDGWAVPFVDYRRLKSEAKILGVTVEKHISNFTMNWQIMPEEWMNNPLNAKRIARQRSGGSEQPEGTFRFKS